MRSLRLNVKSMQFQRTLPSLRGLPAGDEMEDIVFAAPGTEDQHPCLITALYVHDTKIADKYGVQGRPCMMWINAFLAHYEI